MLQIIKALLIIMLIVNVFEIIQQVVTFIRQNGLVSFNLLSNLIFFLSISETKARRR